MARYRTSLLIRRPQADTFAFISDFRNAPTWDPQTRAARKTTDGDIGVGTRFVLVGGALGMTFELPYDVIGYDPPHQFILEGENRVFRYRDVIDFTPHGDNTRVAYHAELRFKGLLRIGNPLMTLVFPRIGDSATRDMAAAVEAGVPACSSAENQHECD